LGQTEHWSPPIVELVRGLLSQRLSGWAPLKNMKMLSANMSQQALLDDQVVERTGLM